MPYEDLYQALALDGALFFSISLREASLLIALDNDLRDQSEIDPELPNDGDYVVGMSPLLEPTGKVKIQRDQIEKGLVRAVELGRIKPVALARDREDRIEAIYTLLSTGDVEAWCREHDLGFGDWWSKYQLDENEFLLSLADEIVAHRTPASIEPGPTDYDEHAMETYRMSVAEQQELLYKEMLTELHSLKQSRSQPRSSPEPDMGTRERNTLLTLIAALINEIADRLPDGTYKRAQTISVMTEKIGASVSPNTVDKILKDAAAVAERRRSSR
ncbi:hypothetical protein M0D68_06955 [Paraburkholderia sp. SEWSISQ10-3 4]|uniref:hypothetical protein n=1 Tax=Paraburkholderia TaxID=1822464 RepID=UPI00225060F7|nr:MULTISPECIES: hypothetical protein [Paraburkholderia]MCX4137916.1 hypothetical protein [Paraburkholderia aspalathi]MDN7170607.1 hypothetical protein [Paraburkholderia sp. SEWSISQ10-3 4]MDQ6500246.1 hypothetical protein [Paraburkholderia aspalathi]